MGMHNKETYMRVYMRVCLRIEIRLYAKYACMIRVCVVQIYLSCSVGPTLAAESMKKSSNNVDTYLSNIQNNFPAFGFFNIPVENVALMLKNLKVSKSTGLDKIPAKVLKKCV